MQEARIQLFEYVYAYHPSYILAILVIIHTMLKYYHICYPSEIVFTLQYIDFVSFFSVSCGRLFTFL